MNCPICGQQAECDEVDNGVGMQQVGPYGCPDCLWVEGDSDEDTAARVAEMEARAAEAERRELVEADAAPAGADS